MISLIHYEALKKLFDELKRHPEKIKDLPAEFCGKDDARAFTVQNLETLAANHLFDDAPYFFGMTELEGSTIRHYFSKGAEDYEFVRDLREQFSGFFITPESEEYLNEVNSRRRSCKLSPI